MIYVRFPELRLLDGRYMRIEMMTQEYRPSLLAPYTIPAGRFDLDKNPFLIGGIPAPTEEAAPEAGMIGGESIDFKFANIPVSVQTSQTLYDIMTVYSAESVMWNIRFFVSATSGSYSARPDFWGIVETSEIDGEQRWLDLEDSAVIGFTARNRIALLEKVTIDSWISAYLLHALYDKQPAQGVFIDGIGLHHYFHNDGATPRLDRDWTTLRFFLLRDVVQSISNSILITTPINLVGTLGSSWRFRRKPDPTNYTLDDVAVVSRTQNEAAIFQHEFMFWDDRSLSDVSVFRLANAGEALRQFIVPFGLMASIQYTADGTAFMELREVQRQYGMELYRPMEGVEFEPAEQAVYGIRVVTANHGEFLANDSGDQSIDSPFMTASRLRTRPTWSTFDADDISCLYQSLYLWLPGYPGGSIVDSVTHVYVRADGLGQVDCELDEQWVTDDDPVRSGNQMARATAFYYFNPYADESDVQTHAPVGVYRRYKQGLSIKEQAALTDIAGTTAAASSGQLVATGLFPMPEGVYKYREVLNAVTGARARVTGKVDANTLALSADIMGSGQAFILLLPRTGDYKLIGTRQWRIRSVTRDFWECTTEYKLERGFLNA